MQRRTESIDPVHSWEQEICDAIKQVQAISHHEKNVLQLHLETHPLPFQPSPVLVHLLQNDRRRRSCSVLSTSAKHRKQQVKSTDYLDRKFESEIRQHYEVENAQKCGKWKQFHFQAAEARRQLAVGIERDFRQFCHQSGIEMAQWGEERGHTKDNQESESLLSPTSSLTNDTTFTEISLSIEDSLRLHLAQEWVHQERFNIQEAFTNQTKKLQEDLDTFMGQQEAGFLEERQKVLNASSLQRSRPENDMTKSNCTKTSSKFQSSTKRGMLLQTAPPLRVEPNGDGESRQLQWRGATAGARVRSSSRHIRSDVDETRDKLDELGRRLQSRKDAAETKRKAGMQWIGRQCAHLFAQLDCKETEARVIALLTAEELTQLGTLRHRACEIAASNKLCQQIRSKEDDCLPLIPGSNSSKRLQQQPKNA
ncbi:uncharacterized protein KRP23_6048 [Phytophthora ramorum]|uniref:uncharacterized protein n=1 Tax=Phytophthora ramorum TaxID=164328 RepID=UPI0030B0AFB9|nr:hypothetical protein KRP23_6048 [Phytophthora ramorum]